MITRNDAKPSKDVELKGLSTDTKPTDVNLVGVNSLFLELDTGDFYYFDGTNWNKLGTAPESEEDPGR